MANINKKYNIVSPDINPFAGTNLDAESTNTNTSDSDYNTYKNTVYKYVDSDSDSDGNSDGWVPNDTVTNGNYPTPGIRNQMDLTSTIKIFQKEGMGSSINTDQLNVHSLRNDKAVEVKPIEYTPNDGVEKGELNHGNWSSHYNDSGYAGDFDKNMEKVTTSDNQMTYRSYASGENDVFTDMSVGIPDESTVSGDDITKGAVIEAGKHFNRGNDTTEVKTENGKTTGVDINSSRVLDMSMYLNNYNSDILSLRGGAGIGITGEYPS